MRAAVQDSDDEGDNEVFVSASANTHTASDPGATSSNEEGTSELAVVKNTNSTELLRQQMLSAERHLVSNSAPMAAGKTLPSSPSLQAQKRRNTAAFGSGAATSPPAGAVKRVKTLTTYGGKNSGRVADENAFEHLRDNVAGTTSPSARFTEHSGHHSSAELPAGSFGAEFVDHEPAVLFRDSGSTVADASSAQRRMLQQALSGDMAGSSAARDLLPGEEDKSSSFPWSASKQTQSRSAKSGNPSKGSVEDEDRIVDADDDKGIGDDVAGTNDNGGGDGAISVNNNEGGDGLETPLIKQNGKTDINETDETIEVHSASRPQASPIVEISQTATRATKTSRRESTSTKTSAKSHKRKSEEPNDSEPLNSDDKAIGLPKERYQPRPSRRRSTQVADEPIDYSVRPEKTAKARRTKTSIAPTDGNREISKEQLANLKTDVDNAKTPSKAVNKRSHEHTQIADANHETSVTEKTKNEVANDSEPVTEHTGSQTHEKRHISSIKRGDDHIFKKPSLPTPQPKPVSQSRRSRTTIFEDHVEFVGSQKSPTLSQQQAARKSARKDINVEGSNPKQRKRKTVVEDEDDDEDELAKDSDGDHESEKCEAAPTKRGRGRPAKGKPQAKSAEKVLEDSEDEGKEEENVEGEDEPAKKKGRGRSTKAASTSKATAIETEDSADASKGPDPLPSAERKDARKSSEDEAEKDQSSKGNGGVIGKENLTPSPSPEKSAKALQKEAKPSPTHSPIKNSSAVPLRVGLSSRRRIPSLLKTFKRPNPKT